MSKTPTLSDGVLPGRRPEAPALPLALAVPAVRGGAPRSGRTCQEMRGCYHSWL